MYEYNTEKFTINKNRAGVTIVNSDGQSFKDTKIEIF